VSHEQHPDTPAAPGDAPALRAAVRALLLPLARLAVARGLPYAVVDAMMREAFVGAAHAAHPNLPEHRRVSRISAATGIHRREVTRLLEAEEPGVPARTRSYPNEVFAHWTTDPLYLDARGRPRVLPRLGQAPSFETLAQTVTRDKHPRTLLEELLRLGLATHDAAGDRVTLARESFVPSGDRDRMDGFLGANVGDHLSAAVENVLGDSRRHFEQAMFAEGLSEASLRELRELIAGQWRTLTSELVPRLEKMIEEDAKDPARADRRVRIGLFSYETQAGEPATDTPKNAAKARRATKASPPAPAATPKTPARAAGKTPARRRQGD
jgi:hypothetical protein